MPTDTITPGAPPADWLEYLLPKLDEQARDVEFYRNYYGGIHRIAYATQRFRDIFGRFFPAAADNWCQVVVDSSVERLKVQGFRFGGLDNPADDAAWDVWQKNKLDLHSRILFLEAVKTGRAYILVDNTDEEPRITVEHPSEVYVHRNPENYDERLAAVKRWCGDDGYSYVFLYLPEAIHKFRSQSRAIEGSIPSDHRPNGSIPNTFDVVPMIPVENNPDMLTGGVSDLEVIIPIQDRVNKLCLDLDVGSEFTAAPQRWATGWEPPTDDKGQPLPETQIKAATSRFLAFKDPETKVGQLPSGDPSAYVSPIEMYIQHIAALSRTPPHYLLGQMVNISGDALKAAETGLVAKCMAKQEDFSDPWEEAIGLATNRDADDARVIWKDPESRTFGQLVDGVVKLRESVALPLEMAWEMIGLSPQQIERAKKLIGLPERDFRALDQGLAMQQREQAEPGRQAQNGNDAEAGATSAAPMNGGRNA